MKAINRILVPTDFSNGAKSAYEYANVVAGVYGSKVDLIHFIPTLKYFQDSFKNLGIPLSMEDNFVPQVIKDTESTLKKDMGFIREEHRGKIISKTDPQPAKAIATFAKKEKYDLILMGAQGDSAEQYIHLGNVTNRVIKLSDVPVMSVTAGQASNEIRNIIVTTDASDASFEALKTAAPIAHKAGARITMLYVFELFGTTPKDSGIPERDESVVSIEDAVLTRIKGFLTAEQDFNLRLNLDPAGHYFDYTDNGDVHHIPVQMATERGVSAHYEIVGYAKEHGDLLVISTSGRSGLPHLLLGSTAEKVIQWAEIPVLTTRTKV